METTNCPDCNLPAEIEWTLLARDSDGAPVKMAKILCINRHWFLCPID